MDNPYREPSVGARVTELEKSVVELQDNVQSLERKQRQPLFRRDLSLSNFISGLGFFVVIMTFVVGIGYVELHSKKTCTEKLLAPGLSAKASTCEKNSRIEQIGNDLICKCPK